VIEIRQAVAIYIAVLGQDLQFDGVMERCYLLSQRRYAGASQNTLSTDPLPVYRMRQGWGLGRSGDIIRYSYAFQSTGVKTSFGVPFIICQCC
jgi:hypothetical protein